MKANFRIFQQICFILLLSSVLASAQTTAPYNNLLITEVRGETTPNNYIEVTNMGTEQIDLAEFEIARFHPWPPNADNWTPDANAHFRLYQPNMYPKNSPLLQKRYLDAGKSFLIATAYDFGPKMWKKDPLHYLERVTKKEFWKKADLLLHVAEPNGVPGLDSITPNYQLLDAWEGYNGFFLRHHFINEAGAKDSMIIDVFNGQFDDADGTNSSNCDCGFDVAGVFQATRYTTLIRKYSVKHGITDFSSHDANLTAAKAQFNQAKGLDLNDSEWIPIPNQGWDESFKAAFWTIGNSVDQKLDANLLESKTGKVIVDLVNAVITVPWGVRDGDSVMFQFKEKPGLGWKYDLSKNSQADSATISATKGDKLTLYVTGSNPVIKQFTIDVLPPTPDDNIVIPKNGYDYVLKRYGKLMIPFSGIRVTDGISGMDTISNIDYATRVDTLFKYLEKAPKATWQIIYKNGISKPDLQTGDLLKVTSESGKIKNYYLKLQRFMQSDNAYLSAITWPDMPASLKAMAQSWGWKGDTIPGFSPTNMNYVVKIPYEYQGIPALMFSKQQTDSKVAVKRAVTLNGSLAERTVTFIVTAENDTTILLYSVRFDKEKDPANVQPFQGEPFISQFVYMDDWANCWMEIVNPRTESLDLSKYITIKRQKYKF